MSPTWLIAMREFRTYVATASFWVALLAGPLLVGGAFLAIGGVGGPTPVRISASDPALHDQLTASVMEAARLERRMIAIAPEAPIAVTARADGRRVAVSFTGGFPLSPAARTLVVRTLERDRLRAQAPTPVPGASLASTPPPSTLLSASPATGRFTMMTVLWLALTGSLGMLLQAVVRERANRALELILASISPWELVVGKVVGVGLVSLLVLGAWLGAVGVAAATSGDTAAPLLGQLQAVGAPLQLARAVLIYVFGFAFYGMAITGLGAQAHDSAAAQNLARPVFAVLLVAFFLAMAAVSGAPPGWLVYAPPVTPFLLLMSEPSANDLLALSTLAISTLLSGAWTISRVKVVSNASNPRFRAGNLVKNL